MYWSERSGSAPERGSCAKTSTGRPVFNRTHCSRTPGISSDATSSASSFGEVEVPVARGSNANRLEATANLDEEAPRADRQLCLDVKGRRLKELSLKVQRPERRHEFEQRALARRVLAEHEVRSVTEAQRGARAHVAELVHRERTRSHPRRRRVAGRGRVVRRRRRFRMGVHRRGVGHRRASRVKRRATWTHGRSDRGPAGHHPGQSHERHAGRGPVLVWAVGQRAFGASGLTRSAISVHAAEGLVATQVPDKVGHVAHDFARGDGSPEPRSPRTSTRKPRSRPRSLGRTRDAQRGTRRGSPTRRPGPPEANQQCQQDDKGRLPALPSRSQARHASRHHSQTFPAMSSQPEGLRPAPRARRREPSTVAVSNHARAGVGGSLPHGYRRPSAPRAQYSHCASVGRSTRSPLGHQRGGLP